MEKTKNEQEYLNLLKRILETGEEKTDRTGTGTRSLFGAQARYDLQESFPLLTTKKVHTKSIIYELLWFLKGDTNTKWLNDHGVTIWDDWTNENGDLGRIYGAQWTDWRTPSGGSINQIETTIEQIKNNPDSRRLIISAWNPGELDQQALPPCHCFVQFYVNNGGLSCQLYQRSCDIFLGVPFNIASYALLTMMFAQVCGLKAKEFIHTYGDVHLYNNHVEQAKLQLTRQPLPGPTMEINPDVKNIHDFKFEDFQLKNYNCQAGIKAPVAV